MLAKTYSYGISGLDAFPVQIEVDIALGLPSTIVVGLPDNAVRESKERVRSAIKNSNFTYPLGRITINLSPADVKKEGPSYDLAIALGILAASGQVDPQWLEDKSIIGELSLDGRVHSVRGACPIALSAKSKKQNILIVPFANRLEAALNNHLSVIGVKTLTEAVGFLSGDIHLDPCKIDIHGLWQSCQDSSLDFADVKGNAHVKRGLEIAAAGGHNCLLIGPPGSGKSMLAKRMPTIIPEMTMEEALETTKIHSACGLLKKGQALVNARPFRSPHHTSSDVAVIGGGTNPKPGEVTLSHNGVLFLDELPEFNRNVLETLRQPLEDRQVTIARANKSLTFPANFMLIAAMNPCLCGWFTDPRRRCQCSQLQIQKYLSKISGPLLDRIDIHLEVPSLPSSQLAGLPRASESSTEIRKRASDARRLQHKRFAGANIHTNAQMPVKQIACHCALGPQEKELLLNALDKLSLSARAHDKILKVARTIADLAGSDNIITEHLAEAIQYRSLDRNWWG